MTSHEPDPFDLQRFVAAQAPAWDRVRAELGAGRKRSHWIWFVFPQIGGLGRSWTAARYAIRGLPEARAYLAHPILGPRLLEATALVAAVPHGDARALMGTPDDLKLRSSMTLFARAAADPTPFEAVLAQFFGGEPDSLTLAKI